MTQDKDKDEDLDLFGNYMIKGIYINNIFFDLTGNGLPKLWSIEDTARVFNRTPSRIVKVSRDLGVPVLEIKGSLNSDSAESKLRLIMISIFQSELVKSSRATEKILPVAKKMLGVSAKNSISHRLFGQKFILAKDKKGFIQTVIDSTGVNINSDVEPISSITVIWISAYIHLLIYDRVNVNVDTNIQGFNEYNWSKLKRKDVLEQNLTESLNVALLEVKLGTPKIPIQQLISYLISRCPKSHQPVFFSKSDLETRFLPILNIVVSSISE